jgi:Dyp-type peroxidase family
LLDFGFLDGISQPAVEGFTTDVLPGQTVVQNGIILTGREGDNVTRPSWALDGTFMAFRYFQQFVPEFNKYLLDNSIQNTNSNLTVQDGADFLGARMFGRWKSGAPLELAPETDNATLGTDTQRNNDFDYGDDTNESKCPFSAHVRKVNPRADLGTTGNKDRAIRSSIPYGPEVTTAETDSNTTSEDRGLLFGMHLSRLYILYTILTSSTVEYQANIANGFRTQQIAWANNAA